jgi:hypothetical protein
LYDYIISKICWKKKNLPKSRYAIYSSPVPLQIFKKKKKTGQTDLPRKKKKPVINGSFKKKIQKKTGLLKSFVRIFL